MDQSCDTSPTQETVKYFSILYLIYNISGVSTFYYNQSGLIFGMKSSLPWSYRIFWSSQVSKQVNFYELIQLTHDIKFNSFFLVVLIA